LSEWKSLNFPTTSSFNAVHNPNNYSFLWKNPPAALYFLEAGEGPTRLHPTLCGPVGKKKPPTAR